MEYVEALANVIVIFLAGSILIRWYYEWKAERDAQKQEQEMSTFIDEQLTKWNEERIDIVGQNGNTGEHYER